MNFQNMQRNINMYIIFGMTEKDEAGTIKIMVLKKYITQQQFFILMEKLILIRRFIEQARKISGQ